MTATPLQSVATWTTAFRQQVRLLSLSKRVWILLAFCTVPLLLSEILRVHRMRTTGMVGIDPVPSHPVVDIVFGILFVSAVWPLLVWRGETWGRRSYHWSMPVDQVKHDLLRVLAGAAWLLVAVFSAAMLAMFFMHLHGAAPIPTPNGSHVHFWPDGRFWAGYFVAPLILYTFGSILPLCVSRPAEWTVALITTFLASVVFLPIIAPPLAQPLSNIFSHPYGLGTALTSQTVGRYLAFLFESGLHRDIAVAIGNGVTAFNPGIRPPDSTGAWAVAVVLWLTFGLVGVVLAAMRRR